MSLNKARIGDHEAETGCRAVRLKRAQDHRLLLDLRRRADSFREVHGGPFGGRCEPGEGIEPGSSMATPVSCLDCKVTA